jgi:biotin transport system substrate-specific component
MNSKVITQSNNRVKIATKSSTIIQVVLGSIFLAGMSQLAIPLPFSPVPITMQTLAVALLTLALGPRNASMAVFTYLAQATVGLPVLAGGVSNPLWMIGPKVGYLVAFTLTPQLIGNLLKSQTDFSFVKTWFIFSLGELSILTLGTFCLGFFFGWQNAFFMGFVPFIPGALFKVSIAVAAFKPVEFIKSKF